MTKEQARFVPLTGGPLNFTEEQRPTSSFTSPRKRRMIIIAVVNAVIIATVVAVVVTQIGKEDSPKSGKEDSPKSDHWCGLILPAGVKMSDLGGPKLLSGGPKTCDITGTCWKKEQCYQCMKGPNRDRVGNINDIPVCCPHCKRYGLIISPKTCDCRY